MERKAGDLTISMGLTGLASRYVTRDLPALLENYPPLRQIEGGLSTGLTDGREPRPGNKERGALGSNEPKSAPFSELVEMGESRTRPETQVGRACEEVSRYVMSAPVCRATVSVSPATSSQRPL